MADDPLSALVARLQEACLGRNLTVATAESCTGGMIASLITDRLGSSGYFLGGIVAYSDAAKQALLDVPAALLEAHGAVSAQVARAMAVGARGRFGASLAVSVTGIAGPGGGTEAKPVGLTYVAVAGPELFHLRPGGSSRTGHVNRSHTGRRKLARRLGSDTPAHFFHHNRDGERTTDGFDLLQQSRKAGVSFRLQRLLQRVQVEDQRVGFRQLDRPAAMIDRIAVIELHCTEVGQEQDGWREAAHAEGCRKRRRFERRQFAEEAGEVGIERPRRRGQPSRQLNRIDP